MGRIAGEKAICCTSALRERGTGARVLMQSSMRRSMAAPDEAGGDKAVAIFDDGRDAMTLRDFKAQMEILLKEHAPHIKIDGSDLTRSTGYFSAFIEKPEDVPGGENLQKYLVNLARAHAVMPPAVEGSIEEPGRRGRPKDDSGRSGGR